MVYIYGTLCYFCMVSLQPPQRFPTSATNPSVQLEQQPSPNVQWDGEDQKSISQDVPQCAVTVHIASRAHEDQPNMYVEEELPTTVDQSPLRAGEVDGESNHDKEFCTSLPLPESSSHKNETPRSRSATTTT